MGSGVSILDRINRVVKGERPEDVIQEEQEEDPYLAYSLKLDEEIRTGKNRPLSSEEQRRFFESVWKKRKGDPEPPVR